MSRIILGTLIGLSSLLTVIANPSLGLKLKDGRTFFSQSPKLVNVMTTFAGTRIQRAIYYYTIDLPERSGQPLRYVTIQKRQGSEKIQYYLDKTIAFEGTPDHRGKALTVQQTQWDEATQTLTIILGTLVAPGTTFSVGVKSKRNPEYGGIYLFGVTAYPEGENPLGLYLGSGRIHFYGGDDGDFD